MATIVSPLREMVATTSTDFCSDSCGTPELRYAMEHGAVGATSNPTIVGSVLKAELTTWSPRIHELFRAQPTWTEAQLAWQLIEELAALAAGLLRSVFEQSGGKKGWLSIQTNPELYKSADALVAQARHFSTLAPNLQVKIPATAAGIVAIEEATALGINVNATVSFTLPQAVAVAGAIERGLSRRAAAGHATASMVPVCTLMIGRLDDCGCLSQLPALVGAGRRRHHPDDSSGMAAQAQRLEVACEAAHRRPVPAPILAELNELEEFRRAFEPDGMAPSVFDDFGATRRTLRAFLSSYYELLSFVRDLRLPDPDV